jgi:hypothetical protein
VLVLVVFAVLASAATAKMSPPIRVLKSVTPTGSSQSSPSVKVSSHRAGAKGVTITLAQLPALLRCGHPSKPVTIALPAAVGVPAKVAASAAHVNGQASSAVVVHKHSLTVAPPRTSAVTCDSIALGTVTVVLESTARISNPAHAGLYRVGIDTGSANVVVSYSIS